MQNREVGSTGKLNDNERYEDDHSGKETAGLHLVHIFANLIHANHSILYNR
jgi:hypothetical protein